MLMFLNIIYIYHINKYFIIYHLLKQQQIKHTSSYTSFKQLQQQTKQMLFSIIIQQ